MIKMSGDNHPCICYVRKRDMKYLLLTTIAAVVVLLFGGVNEVNADPLTYRVAGGNVSIVSCDKSASGELVIPSTYKEKPVTSIGGSAFYNCSRITSARIPDSVTRIGSSAFSGCSRLTSVRIPDSVTSIGKFAFEACRGLTSVTIPDSVTSIGEGAFSHCRGLTSVTIPDSVTATRWMSLTSRPDRWAALAIRSCTSLYRSLIDVTYGPLLGINNSIPNYRFGGSINYR